MQTLLPHFSHLRRPPEHVARGLRAVDPTAELVYLGYRRWLLVSVRPHSAHQAAASRILSNARRLLEVWRANPKFRANPGAFRRLIGRHDFALLASMGARPIAEYFLQGEPTSAVVDDFRCRDWCYRHFSDNDVQRMLDAPHDDKLAESRADLTDVGRARDAWRYAFTRSHWYGDRPGRDRGPRSGFRRDTVSPLSS